MEKDKVCLKMIFAGKIVGRKILKNTQKCMFFNKKPSKNRYFCMFFAKINKNSKNAKIASGCKYFFFRKYRFYGVFDRLEKNIKFLGLS